MERARRQFTKSRLARSILSRLIKNERGTNAGPTVTRRIGRWNRQWIRNNNSAGDTISVGQVSQGDVAHASACRRGL